MVGKVPRKGKESSWLVDGESKEDNCKFGGIEFLCVRYSLLEIGTFGSIKILHLGTTVRSICAPSIQLFQHWLLLPRIKENNTPHRKREREEGERKRGVTHTKNILQHYYVNLGAEPAFLSHIRQLGLDRETDTTRVVPLPFLSHLVTTNSSISNILRCKPTAKAPIYFHHKNN